ncbi:hypothetical protein BI364_15080 [Acidihalobacter yilgarnensis]|uniref:HTH crp-type domain-containing protein n=1 Tax=Acidihalobacter yilgarnensis TaxID=2819280 RepID=A0A1D8IRQ6_9GAMM|nr:helix-turn-helix domain-containing protein [Acidihalobacter yilgarnensis]AOU99087.1 hypothetical protein BI364_15080 [Acidihalobacter yilgarnensis]
MGDDGHSNDWLVRRKTMLASCTSCHLRARCVIAAIPTQHLDAIGHHVHALRPVHRGDTIYRAGEPVRRLLIVHAGSVRTSLAWRGGREIICDYHLPGDTLGLEELHASTYVTTSVALESTQLCELSHESLAQLASAHPGLRERICLQTSRALTRSHRRQLEIAVKTVEQRLAGFLLELSARFAERGYSSCAFRLPLSRQEIANHLGMRTETLSRLLATFLQRGLITLIGREIRLLQPNRLGALSGG